MSYRFVGKPYRTEDELTVYKALRRLDSGCLVSRWRPSQRLPVGEMPDGHVRDRGGLGRLFIYTPGVKRVSRFKNTLGIMVYTELVPAVRRDLHDGLGVVFRGVVPAGTLVIQMSGSAMSVEEFVLIDDELRVS